MGVGRRSGGSTTRGRTTTSARTLADGPWFATVPLLAAAAAVTERIRLGTFVASPNFRHPAPFAKDVLGLDDVSGGRFLLGIGAGGEGFDAAVTGPPCRGASGPGGTRSSSRRHGPAARAGVDRVHR